MFKYFKKRKAVKAAQAAYSQESREYFKLTQELEDAQKELKTLESEWMNGLDYGQPEGSTTLPEGFQIVFLKVQVKA